MIFHDFIYLHKKGCEKMSTLDKILELMKKNNIGNKDLALPLGLTPQAITDWKAGRSKSYTKYLYQIAEFFNTTPEYLKCESDDIFPKTEKALPKQEELSASAKRLIELYHMLNTEGQEKLTDYADDLVTSGKYKKDSTISVGSEAI